MVTGTMLALQGLKQMGFTENEAKVYLALMKHPGVTGYEVSRFSGVPRAKVYEVLDGLEQRGAVLLEPGEDRTLYRALPYTALLGEYRRRTDLLLTDLYRDLSQHVKPVSGPATVTITGLGRVLARAGEIIATARQTLVAAGRPEELQALGAALAESERRGVLAAVLSRGPVRLNLREVYVQAARNPDPALALVVDGQIALLADLADPAGAHAVLTTLPAVARTTAAWMRKEMAFGEIERLVGERLFDLLPASAVQHMTRLWRS